mgnify:CR=1 FL=1|jgi:hypothetical protein
MNEQSRFLLEHNIKKVIDLDSSDEEPESPHLIDQEQNEELTRMFNGQNGSLVA